MYYTIRYIYIAILIYSFFNLYFSDNLHMVLILHSNSTSNSKDNISAKNNELMRVARQMINIEMNSHIYNDISTNEAINVKQLINAYPNLLNSYELYNEFDPENPIDVELYPSIGNVIIYTDEPTLYESPNTILRTLLKFLKSLDSEINIYNGLDNNNIKCQNKYFVQSSHYYISSFHTHIYNNQKAYITRKLHYEHKLNKNKPKSNEREFLWNISIINPYAFDIYKYLSLNIKGMSSNRIDCIKSYIQSKKISIINNNQEYTVDAASYLNDVVGIINSYIMVNNSYDNNLDPYSAGTIIVDQMNILQTKNMQELTSYKLNHSLYKQLNMPKLEQFNFSKYTNLILYANSPHTLELAITWCYNPHIITRLYKSRYSFYDKNIKKMMIGNLSDISWVPQYPSENLKINPIIYYMNNTIADINCNHVNLYIYNNISSCIDDIKNIYANKTTQFKNNNLFKLNEPDNKCFITGTPLYANYIEMQTMVNLKITSRVTMKIILIMHISALGIIQLSNLSSGNYDELYTPILNEYKNNNASSCNNNIIMQKTPITIVDVIKKIDKGHIYNPHICRQLLLTIEKYGAVSFQNNVYSINPDTNDIYIGMPLSCITDNLLINMEISSDAIIYGVDYR